MISPTSEAPLSSDYLQLLDQASILWGIEPEFWDIWGQHHVPSAETKHAILRSLGIACESSEQLARAIEDRRASEWTRPIPATRVLSAEEARECPIRMEVERSQSVLFVSSLSEEGVTETAKVDLSQCPTSAAQMVNGRGYVEKRVAWPFVHSPGYYEVKVELEGREAVKSNFIVSPLRAWVPEHLGNDGRTAGVAISLYGVRSQRNWGVGDTTDMEALLDWLKRDLHCSFLALNPLHAIENRQPYNVSPYLPSSAFFRNPLYIDVERIDEFGVSEAAQKWIGATSVQTELQALRAAPLVEYERVWRLKRFFLKLLFREFHRRPQSDGASRFAQYCQSQGERLEKFATYCALWDWFHRRNRDIWTWPEWPIEYQDPDSSAVAQFRNGHGIQITFYKYLQWLLDEQLATVQRKAQQMGIAIGLYHDLALATDRCGADVWAYRPYYVAGCRVGSPPDGFAPEGQDWAFPPPNVEKHHESGYRLFIDLIRANSRHGGALRIDHVMRLFRLYWIPDGMDARNGAYVRDNHEDLLKILALESHRARAIVVGEDLGTVNDMMGESLQNHGILSYKVFYFEKAPDGRFRRPEEYKRQALVSSTTHDLPTLAGFWIGRDIEARKAAGLLPDGASYERQLTERAIDKQRMLEVLRELRLLPEWFPKDVSQVPELSGELHNAIIGFLVQTPSMLMVLNQEDLTKETEQQNLPASTWQYPNWRRKMTYTVEELSSLETTQNFALMFRNWLDRAGRGSSVG